MSIGFIQGNINDKMDRIKKLYEKLKSFSVVEPQISLILARRIAEDICRDLFSRSIYNNPGDITLEPLIDTLLDDDVIPRVIAIHLNAIQILSDDLDDFEEYGKLLPPCLHSLDVVVKWYLGETNIDDDQLHKELLNKTNQLVGEAPRPVLVKQEKLGTSSFAKLKDMKKVTGEDGLIIGSTLRLSERKSFEHAVCVGPTGSGKTASYFIPNLLSLPNASCIVSDPKGEIFKTTAATNIAQGKRVLVFSPYHENTMRYNPLSLCRNVTEIRELAQMILTNGNKAVEAMTGGVSGGAEWINMATPLLTAGLLFVRSLEPPKNTISTAMDLLVENEIETLRVLFKGESKEAKKQFNIFMQAAESEKTASSIRTVLASCAQLFVDPTVVNATSYNELNPKYFSESPTVLYVIVPEHKSATLAPLMAPFYTQLMAHLVERKSKVPVYFFLDEFANIGIIPNIDTALATFRSRKISISIGIQSINQLISNYGKEKAHTILDNLKTKFVFPGLSVDSAKYFSELFGQKEIVSISRSLALSENSNIGINSNPQKRDLLTPDEIRRLDDETLVAVVDNLNPYIDKQIRYFKNNELLELTRTTVDLDKYLKDQRNILN
ncbi:hypothetical protein CIB95_12605 [Lottiidibacillus patelloidae]|uniref:Conjugal transfer protein TraG n=1 Tax=Lottiidibacillus patelloidae TaxID=2670334 RepID=A0A263BRQ8_9BACI|nr:type IV secretory system conjugative DNA transfer family protein [Lottiidibacillus patelloidae]OZM56258.1 hypothetical protein CIB95_12605 [Lottiidibacillus patelloidae]